MTGRRGRALTKRAIDGLPPGGARVILWDSDPVGFGLLALPSGARSFIVSYRTAQGRQRRQTIGAYGVLTLDEARRQARKILGQVATGADPMALRRAERSAVTVYQLADDFLREHGAKRYTARSLRNVEYMLDGHIRPRLGAIGVRAATRQDMARFHHALADRPRTANLALAILSKMFSLAELWGLRPEDTNPCRKVPRFPETARERFLSGEEIERLGRAIEIAEREGLPWRERDGAKAKHRPLAFRSPLSAPALAVIRLLLFTGARLSEILELEWSQVDRRRGMLALPGRKGSARVWHPVSTMALDIVAALPETPSRFVFPSAADPDRPRDPSSIESAWRRLRAFAGLDDVRIHDLRHTVGTYASQTGVNAFGVRDLLRHKSLATTGRYANADSDPTRALSERVGERIAAALGAATTSPPTPAPADQSGGRPSRPRPKGP